MPATTFNHVAIHADSIEDSVAFYTDVFGMEPIPQPRPSLRTGHAAPLRDAADNLVEVDWPDVTTVDLSP